MAAGLLPCCNCKSTSLCVWFHKPLPAGTIIISRVSTFSITHQKTKTWQTHKWHLAWDQKGSPWGTEWGVVAAPVSNQLTWLQVKLVQNALPAGPFEQHVRNTEAQ